MNNVWYDACIMKPTNAQIHKHMTVLEIMTLFPAAAEIMSEYGMHCFNCSVGGIETLVEAGNIHAMNEETIDMLIDDLNEAFNDGTTRPLDLTITKEAAEGIEQIAKEQEQTEKGLEVIVDKNGQFCMEFRDAPAEGDRVFRNLAVPSVRVYCSPLTLSRIGGATIDLREGRFKLDVEQRCCGNKQECDCHKQ